MELGNEEGIVTAPLVYLSKLYKHSAYTAYIRRYVYEIEATEIKYCQVLNWFRQHYK
jgi:hypothetical protein